MRIYAKQEKPQKLITLINFQDLSIPFSADEGT